MVMPCPCHATWWCVTPCHHLSGAAFLDVDEDEPRMGGGVVWGCHAVVRKSVDCDAMSCHLLVRDRREEEEEDDAMLRRLVVEWEGVT